MNIIYRVALAAAAMTASAIATPPPPPHPLDTLCERLCGGVWRAEGAEVQTSDAMVTTWSYLRDDLTDLIHGTITTQGGIAGVHEERVVVYGVNPQNGQVWTLGYSGRAAPVYGEVTLTADGYMAQLRPLGGDTSTMTVAIVFDGPDRYTQTMEISHAGGHTIAAPQIFVRPPAPPPPG